MSTARALGAPRVPSIVPLLNPIIRRLLGAGMPFGPNALFSVRGRTSGQLRTFPIAILEVDGRRYVQSPFGEVNWVRNLRASGKAVVTKGSQREEVEATEVDPEAAGAVLQAGLAPYLRSRFTARIARRFFDVRADSTLRDFVVEAGRHPMFELHPRAQSTMALEGSVPRA
ncbi:MAG TPA: nitroreductase family deazaflavin-dependent oxidoreductase [Candidatus Limnocylindrales bacterium]